MTVDDDLNYGDYLRHISNLGRIGALFAGFDFTVVTLLLTQLPDPSSTLAQTILYFMAALFLVLIFLVGWAAMLNLYLCRRVPPNSPPLKVFAVLSFAVHLFVCVPIFLMFFLWEMNALGFATMLTWGVFVFASIVFIWRPLRRFKETRSYLLRLPEPDGVSGQQGPGTA